MMTNLKVLSIFLLILKSSFVISNESSSILGRHILLLGGNAESEAFGEVITSDGSSCQYSGTEEMYHGMGGLFENVPTFCGGSNTIVECYQLEGESFVAQPDLMLETPLKSAAYTSYRFLDINKFLLVIFKSCILLETNWYLLVETLDWVR